MNLNASAVAFTKSERIVVKFVLLFYMLAHTTLNRHGFQDVNRGNSYIVIAFVD